MENNRNLHKTRGFVGKHWCGMFAICTKNKGCSHGVMNTSIYSGSERSQDVVATFILFTYSF